MKYFPQQEKILICSVLKTHKTISAFNPDIIINCAAKVGGILANNNLRTEFILENLKININIFEACIIIQILQSLISVVAVYILLMLQTL